MNQFNFSRFKRSFFKRPTLEVAKGLIGSYLVKIDKKGLMVGKIVETEAYIGSIDTASHAFNKKRTSRTEVQYGLPGLAYVYLIYGLYSMFCVVTEPKSKPACVFIRSLEPVVGQELMRCFRGLDLRVACKNPQRLCSGPGMLTQAFNIKKKISGKDLCSANSNLFFAKGKDKNIKISRGKRIGINYAKSKDVNRLWRFYLKDSLFLSN